MFSADQALAAIDAFQGPDAMAFSKGFSDQFLTDHAQESAKEAFYREGLKLPRPYLVHTAGIGDISRLLDRHRRLEQHSDLILRPDR